jgi:NAD(P)-dependent dehydrogenase (short-subunit alcohol dehydrogenase family)
MTGRGRLDRRVAIVTGASAGIGEATARALAGAGVRVAVCARRGDRLERLAAGLAGRDIAVYALDVTDAGAVGAMVDEVGARWGRLDVLVNNAGRGLAATVEDTAAGASRSVSSSSVRASRSAWSIRPPRRPSSTRRRRAAPDLGGRAPSNPPSMSPTASCVACAGRAPRSTPSGRPSFSPSRAWLPHVSSTSGCAGCVVSRVLR